MTYARAANRAELKGVHKSPRKESVFACISSSSSNLGIPDPSTFKVSVVWSAGRRRKTSECICGLGPGTIRNSSLACWREIDYCSVLDTPYSVLHFLAPESRRLLEFPPQNHKLGTASVNVGKRKKKSSGHLRHSFRKSQAGRLGVAKGSSPNPHLLAQRCPFLGISPCARGFTIIMVRKPWRKKGQSGRNGKPGTRDLGS